MLCGFLHVLSCNWLSVVHVRCRCSIDAMSLAVAAPPRLGLQQGSLPHPGVPLLYVSAGLQEVGLWDVLHGKCHQVGEEFCLTLLPV